MKATIALVYLWVILLMLFITIDSSRAENVDSSDRYNQYAYGENVGWLNSEPSGEGGPGVEVNDARLTGYIWGENIGWVSLSCRNTKSCKTVFYETENDGMGNITGWAWSSNVGWISFSCENTGSCDSVEYGVKILSPSGKFSGYAWGENIGWINFNSTGATAYAIRTSWRGPFALPWMMLLLGH